MSTVSYPEVSPRMLMRINRMKRESYRSRIRYPQNKLRVIAIFKDCRGVNYQKMSNGQIEKGSQ